MTRKLDSRMRAIEQKAEMLTRFAPVHVAIRRSLFYDELPEDSWRDLYCEFIGFDRCIVEDVMQMVLNDLHFVLHEIEKPTPEELQEIIAWVESRVNDSGELET